MNILLINAYSAENRGDAGIVASMIHLLKKHKPDASIKVMSSYHDQNEKFYSQYGVESVENVWSLKPKNNFFEKYLIGLSKLVSIKFNKKVNNLNHFEEADLIISVGGGYLYSSKKGSLGPGLLNALFHIWLAKHVNKKLICFPQSVGPLNSRVDYYLVRKILKKVDLFFSREQTTTLLLKDMGVKNVKEVSDIGFLLPDKKSNFKVNKENLNLGITVMDWRFSRGKATEAELEVYINKIKWIIQKLKEEHSNLSVYIFPQVTVNEGDSDYHQSKYLYNKLNLNEKFLVDLKSHVNYPEQLVDMYGKMNLFIGSRMHSTIFSLAGGVPTIALSYQPKTLGTFKRLGLQDFVYDIEHFNENEVLNMMLEIIRNDQNYKMDTLKGAQLQIEDEVKKILYR
ncbi:polysaccharide pyruvyl transferase family protein [Exiguobacterium sp. ZWU0009]|uniref:polysaccharide pyruvyl transferase family protein n=1 Tax=Exiguobacterium sp. ZWU0009 TaxID=1224749 RepID=UPI000648B453|nr:polysaccharide pyruvyl transferase family protein [Exiguobacterium sp. ZWU0009]